MNPPTVTKTARDVMTESVLSVAPETRIDDAMDILLENRISGLPVVGDDGCIVGVLTEVDRLKMIKNPFARHYTQVADIMTRNVVCVDADERLEHIAYLLLSGAIRRVPVVEQGHVIGIVSRRDLVRAMLERPSA